MKNKQNGVAAVLVILIATVAMAGVGAYFYFNQNAGQKMEAGDTANWQIYKNEKCGYEIKYPQGYQAEESVSFVAFNSATGGSNFIYCFLAADLLKGVSSLQEYIKQEVKGHSISENFQPKSINVGNITGTEVEGFGSAGSYKDIYLQEGDYILQFNIEKESNETGIKIFDQMLSTFKLIEPQAVVVKTEILARKAKDLEGQAEKVQLADGTACVFMGGATGVNAKNERLNYQCGDSKNLSIVIYGDLTEGDVWTANASSIELDEKKETWNVISTKTVNIAKVWR